MLVVKNRVFINLLENLIKKLNLFLQKKKLGKNYPLKQSMNVGKYFKLIKNKTILSKV